MDYIGSIYRPPSEAYSMLIQVTVGCSHNRCTFCAMYKDKQFKAKKWEIIKRDIEEAASFGPRFDRIFLCDGDALVLSTDKLMQILQEIKHTLPWVTRVGMYGDPQSVKNKTVDDLKALQQAGLSIIYHGLESGHEEVLNIMGKETTPQENIHFATMLKAAEITHSAIVLLGAGGTELSQEHAQQSAYVLNKMNADYIAALMLTIVPGTPLYEEQAQGRFTLPDKFGLLQELRTLIEGLDVHQCRFSANHASNYLPIKGTLPHDKKTMLDLLDQVLRSKDESLLKPEYMRAL